jgi:3-dehydroquinate synthase
LEKIIINTNGFISEIFIGENWEAVSRLIPEHNTVIVTDDNVNRLYGSRFPRFPVFSISPGEESKKLEVIGSLAEKMLDTGVDRSGFVLAIGGGVVCDVAGFLAAVYMRGISCGYVSSTLLSQVDASTGGKNGVNLGGTKNMLGTIRQPEFVICDPAMLITLPEQEYLSGLAELIKTAVIGNKELFELIEVNVDQIMSRNQQLLISLIAESVRFKALVVSKDEQEKGQRRILNFGHTFGHAVEMQNSVKHGFAVASGMKLAADFSFEKGYIGLEEKERIIDLLRRFNLIDCLDIREDLMEKLVLHDKKKTGTDIHFVFTQGIGKALVEKIPVGEMLGFYRRYRNKK